MIEESDRFQEFEDGPCRIVFDTKTSIVRVYCTKPTLAAKQLHRMLSEKWIDHIEAIIYRSEERPDLIGLIKGADIYRFVYAHEEPKPEKPKKKFSEIVKERETG